MENVTREPGGGGTERKISGSLYRGCGRLGLISFPCYFELERTNGKHEFRYPTLVF